MQGLEKYWNRLTTSRRRIDAMGADGDRAPRGLFGGTLYYLDATLNCPSSKRPGACAPNSL